MPIERVIIHTLLVVKSPLNRHIPVVYSLCCSFQTIEIPLLPPRSFVYCKRRCICTELLCGMWERSAALYSTVKLNHDHEKAIEPASKCHRVVISMPTENRGLAQSCSHQSPEFCRGNMVVPAGVTEPFHPLNSIKSRVVKEGVITHCWDELKVHGKQCMHLPESRWHQRHQAW